MQSLIATKIMKFECIKNEENSSDILTKPLSNEKFDYLVKKWLFRDPNIQIKLVIIWDNKHAKKIMKKNILNQRKEEVYKV
jgi:hypothetical protein